MEYQSNKTESKYTDRRTRPKSPLYYSIVSDLMSPLLCLQKWCSPQFPVSWKSHGDFDEDFFLIGF